MMYLPGEQLEDPAAIYRPKLITSQRISSSTNRLPELALTRGLVTRPMGRGGWLLLRSLSSELGCVRVGVRAGPGLMTSLSRDQSSGPVPVEYAIPIAPAPAPAPALPPGPGLKFGEFGLVVGSANGSSAVAPGRGERSD